MLEYQSRVHEENDALQVKIGKLTSFIETSPAFRAIDATDQALLILQLGHMRAYAGVLGIRISRF